ncbi:MAG: hypothetical protein KCHDKBKB_03004 [Elusimicrobia bacterium]|nr:hypothetical protein [Elusimicrobiota bacterium]
MFPHTFLSTPLRPWSSDRECYYLSLATEATSWISKIDNPLELLPVLEEQIAQELAAMPEDQRRHPDSFINWSRFRRAAARVLWLASHDDETIRAAATSAEALHQTIEQWLDDGAIPDTELITAVRLAHRLRIEHRDSVVIPRPGKDTRKSDLGN